MALINHDLSSAVSFFIVSKIQVSEVENPPVSFLFSYFELKKKSLKQRASDALTDVQSNVWWRRPGEMGKSLCPDSNIFGNGFIMCKLKIVTN